MKKRYRILFAVMILAGIIFDMKAQSLNPWNNHKCAVVLTYDDGLNVHLDNVIPMLNFLGLKGTFYIPGNAPTLNTRIEEWRLASKNGHELGNHTLFHPCNGSVPGREWVAKDYDLAGYTLARMMDEITTANKMLKAIDGKETRTFAYTCGDKNAGSVSFVELLKKQVAGARTVEFKYETIKDADIYNIGSYFITGQTAEEMISKVKEAMQNRTLLVFLFHGVGGEHNLDVNLDEHNKLLKFLKENEKEIWIAPLVDVTAYITANKQP